MSLRARSGWLALAATVLASCQVANTAPHITGDGGANSFAASTTVASGGACTLTISGSVTESDPCTFAVSAEGSQTIFRVDFSRTDTSPGASDAWTEVHVLTHPAAKTYSPSELKATGAADVPDGASSDNYTFSLNYGTDEGSLDQFTLTSVTAGSPPNVHGRLRAGLIESSGGSGALTFDVSF